MGNSYILAIIGTVLAVPQLIDREAADALQAWARGIATDVQLRLLALIIIQSFFTLIVCIFVFALLVLVYNFVREDKT